MDSRSAIRIATAGWFLFAFAAVPGRADEGTVTGWGTTDLQVVPEIMRVRIELVTKGKDLKEAIDKLKSRREAAREKLVALGATKDSISFNDPGVGTEALNRQRVRGGYVFDRGGPGGPPQPPKSKGPQPVFVSTAVSAELPLKAAGPDEFLLAANTLQEKIKAADLGGLKDTGKMSPQEEEIVEERGLQPTGEEGGPKPGEPVFLFVGRIGEAQRTKAAADAFQKAKQQAARLARAAESDLGDVRDLKESVGPGSTGDEADAEAEYYARAAMYGRQDFGASSAEAVSAKAGRVNLRIGVTVKYALKSSSAR